MGNNTHGPGEAGTTRGAPVRQSCLFFLQNPFPCRVPWKFHLLFAEMICFGCSLVGFEWSRFHCWNNCFLVSRQPKSKRKLGTLMCFLRKGTRCQTPHHMIPAGPDIGQLLFPTFELGKQHAGSAHGCPKGWGLTRWNLHVHGWLYGYVVSEPWTLTF